MQQGLQQVLPPDMEQQLAQQVRLSSEAQRSPAQASSGVGQPDSIDAELQSLIQQHKAALQHLEGLSARRALLRPSPDLSPASTGAQNSPGSVGESPGAAALPLKRLLSRATTPPPTLASLLPSSALQGRWTSPSPDFSSGASRSADAGYSPSHRARPTLASQMSFDPQGSAEGPVQPPEGSFPTAPHPLLHMSSSQPDADTMSRYIFNSTSSFNRRVAYDAPENDLASSSNIFAAGSSNSVAASSGGQAEVSVAASKAAHLDEGSGHPNLTRAAVRSSHAADSSQQPADEGSPSPSSLQAQLAAVKLRKQKAAVASAAPKPDAIVGQAAPAGRPTPKQAPPLPPTPPAAPIMLQGGGSTPAEGALSQHNSMPVWARHVGAPPPPPPPPPSPPPPPPPPPPPLSTPKAAAHQTATHVTHKHDDMDSLNVSSHDGVVGSYSQSPPRMQQQNAAGSFDQDLGSASVQPQVQASSWQQSRQLQSAQVFDPSGQLSAMQPFGQQQPQASAAQGVRLLAAMQSQDAQFEANRPVKRWPAVQTNPLFQTNPGAVSASSAPLMPGRGSFR